MNDSKGQENIIDTHTRVGVEYEMSFDLTPKTFFKFSKVIIAGTILGSAIMLGNLYFFDLQTNEIDIDINNANYPTSKNTSLSRLTSDTIGELSNNYSCIHLATLPVTYRIPDIRSLILYHGTNKRPDAPTSTSLVTFSLRSDPSRVISVASGVKVPLCFEMRQNSGKWVVPASFQDEPLPDTPITPLTITITPNENGATVKVDFTPPCGQHAVVESNHEATFFTVLPSPIPIAQTEIQKWKLGEYTVDPSILERQKITWYGKDNVIDTLGDDDWEYQKTRQRVQFGHNEEAYVLWVDEGDCFTFEDGVWIPQIPGNETVGKALLVVTSIQDKSIIWTLWNEEGTIHLPLQTLRKEQVFSQEKDKKPIDIKIVGAKSKSRWIMEINGQRLIVQPTDWLIIDEKQPHIVIIDNPTILSDYLEGKINGTLLAFQRLEKRGTDQFLTGIVFDSTRVQAQPVAVSLYRSWEKANGSKNNPLPKKNSRKADEDDENEDDEFFINEDDDLNDTKNAGPDDDLFQDDFNDE